MTKRYEMYQDNLGQYWCWCEETKSNLVYRAKTELEAYKAALDQAVFIISLHRERQDKAEVSLEKLQKVFEEVFPNDTTW